jgi:hypothetical protein
VPWGHWKTTTFVAALRVGEIGQGLEHFHNRRR